MGRRQRSKISSGHLVQKEKTSNNDYIIKGKEEYHIERKKDRSGDDIIILKSGTEIIDIPFSALKKKLMSLFEVRNTRLHDLSQSHKEELQSIITIMSSLYNTSCYNEVVELIDSIFSKGGDTVKPGSVYAYFYGCKIQTNFTPFSCSPVCAGSLQPIDMGSGWEICDKMTILFNSENRKFTIMNNPSNNEDAYIYVQNGSGFGSLTEAEKASLSKLGVKRIKVVSFDSTGTRTTDINSDFIPIEDINLRNITSSSSDAGWGWLWILIAILVILLVVGIVILFTRKGRKGEGGMAEGSFYSENASPGDEESMYESSPLSELGREPRSQLATSMTRRY
jgi:hypothetical protein